MESTRPQVVELKQIFIELDQDNDGFINKLELRDYMKKQTNQPSLNDTNRIMRQMKNKQLMDEHTFLTWVLSSRLNLQQLAISRCHMQNWLNNYSPAPQQFKHKQVKRSSIQLNTLSQLKKKQHFINIQFGTNSQSMIKQYEIIRNLLKRQLAPIIFYLKLKCKDKINEICECIKSIINIILQFIIELEPNFSLFTNLLIINCQQYENNIYLIIQLDNSFLNDLVKFYNQSLMILSPQCQFLFNFLFQSNFQNLLHNNSILTQNASKLSINCSIDNVSMYKIKDIIKNIIGQQTHLNSTVMTGLLIILFEHVNLSADFDSLIQIFQGFGIPIEAINPQQAAQIVKQIGIKQQISNFIPEALDLLNLLQNNCQPKGQICLNSKNISFRVQFDLLIEEIFDLL